MRFTPRGWLYITDEKFTKKIDRAKTRTPTNVMRRVKMLPKVKEVLQRTEYVDEIRKMPDGTVRYGLLGRFEDGSIVRVVIEEVKQGGKKFLSVFDWKEVSKKMGRISPSNPTKAMVPRGMDGASPGNHSRFNKIPSQTDDVKKEKAEAKKIGGGDELHSWLREQDMLRRFAQSKPDIHRLAGVSDFPGQPYGNLSPFAQIYLHYGPYSQYGRLA